MDKTLTTKSNEWTLKMPTVPPRSRLYHLEPVGIGTPQVESLTSYIIRLAEAHCVSVAALYKYELDPVVRSLRTGKFQLEASSHNRLSSIYETKSLNGFCDSSKTWVQALESSTLRSGLHLLTTLSWGTAIGDYGLLRETPAWCPACYEEWREAGTAIYMPLAWMLNAFTVCTNHVRLLEELCPLCCSRPHILAYKSRPGFCSRCQNWLGVKLSNCIPTDEAVEAEDFFYRTWTSNTLWQWISAAQELSNPPSRETISLIISGLISLVTNGNVKAFANVTGLYPELVYNWLKKRSCPCLDFILRICSTFNLSITELLTNQCFTSSELTLSETLDDLRHKVPATPTFNKTILLASLTEALNEEPPPSLQEIADRLGYKDASALRFTARNLCKKITARYRSYIKMMGEKMYSIRNYETVRATLEQALEKDYPPSIIKISSDLKYKCDKTLYQRFPDLCRRIVAKREEFKKQLYKDRERIMKAVLNEEPPPSLREVGRRFGANSANSIYRLFPELCQAIVARHSEWKKKCAEQMMLILQAALKEEPPRLLKEIAKELSYTVQAISIRHPQLCKMISARYAAYQRKLIEEKKRLFMEEVRKVALKLIEQGIHPSEEQVKSRMENPNLRNFVELNKILREIRKEFVLPNLGYGPASRDTANLINGIAP